MSEVREVNILNVIRFHRIYRK